MSIVYLFKTTERNLYGLIAWIDNFWRSEGEEFIFFKSAKQGTSHLYKD